MGTYSQNAATKAFVDALSRSAGIPADHLMQNLSNVPNEQKGTWVHPTIAIHLAMWCSPKFAVWAATHLMNYLKLDRTTTAIAPPAEVFKLPKTFAEALRMLEDIRAQTSPYTHPPYEANPGRIVLKAEPEVSWESAYDDYRGVQMAAPNGLTVDAETGELIQHHYLGNLIEQRAGDGYVNATAMCKAHGKKFSHYSENAATKAFVDELKVSAGIPADTLLCTLSNVPNAQKGTWVHPQVAIHLAMWCSSAFAVWATGHLLNYMRHTPAIAPPAEVFKLPKTFAEALRALADSSDANEALLLENREKDVRIEEISDEKRLAENAREAAEAMSKLQAEERAREVRAELLTKWLNIRVSDTGFGPNQGRRMLYFMGYLKKACATHGGGEPAHLPGEVDRAAARATAT